MTATVARQEDHRSSGQFAGEETIGGLAEGCGDGHPFLTGQSFDVIKSAAADDADAIGSHKVEPGNKDNSDNEPPLRCFDADAETSGVQTGKLFMAIDRPPIETPRRIESA